MNTLAVELKIPLETQPLIGASALTFSRYLPIGKENGITISEEDMDILLWFDLQSTWWASNPSEEELKNHINVLAHYLRAEVHVQEIESDLAIYIQQRDFKRLPNESEEKLQKEYEQLGLKILRNLINRINRLIAYARTVKGQYWLLEFQFDQGRMHSYYQSFEAKGRIDDNELFRFQPGVGDHISISITPEDKYIREEEWSEVKEYVTGSERTSLVLELLAGAEQLAGNDYTRSALTEAVTGLEVAICAFGRSQDNNDKLTSLFGPRLALNRLSKQIDHMGLSGTIRYLLPLIFPEHILPQEVLVGCQEAITERQNVVHNGKRNVKNVNHFIESIRRFCEIIFEYSVNESNKNI